MALAQELIAEEPPVRNTLELRAMAMQRLGKQCVELTRVTERFGERTVIDNVDWIIGPGDRIGVLGENGAGKTTLLKITGRHQAHVRIREDRQDGQIRRALPASGRA